MPKRRKRTNKDVPAKGRLKDMADQLWSLAVKEDWANRCAICGRRGDLNSHHLIPRQHLTTRFDLRNGICLCRACHRFCPFRSPHQTTAGWTLWLKAHHPTIEAWCTETTATQEYKRFDGATNAAYYCDQIRRLREYVEPEDFERIVGQRFSAWLEENE